MTITVTDLFCGAGGVADEHINAAGWTAVKAPAVATPYAVDPSTVEVIEPAPAIEQGDVPLLCEAAQAARDHGDSLRADWFDMAADDHDTTGCPSDGPCIAVRGARSALAEYGYRPADTGKETDR